MMDELEQRAAVCTVARSWLRTPYRDCARIKGIGVDCAMLVAAVMEEAGVVTHIEVAPYSRQWHVNRGGQRYMDMVLACGARAVEAPQPADLVLYKFGRSFAHGAIVLDPGWPQIIEASSAAKCVQFARGDKGIFADVERRFFSLW